MTLYQNAARCRKVKGTLQQRYERRREVGKTEGDRELFPSAGSCKETVSPFVSHWKLYDRPGSCNWWPTAGRTAALPDFTTLRHVAAHIEPHVRLCLWRLREVRNNEFGILCGIIKKISPLCLSQKKSSVVVCFSELWRVYGGALSSQSRKINSEEFHEGPMSFF